MSTSDTHIFLRPQNQGRRGPSVRAAMTAPVRFIAPHVNVIDAVNMAREWGVHHIPVGTSDAPIGLVCTCDLRDAPLDGSLGQWATHPALTISASAPCVQAARMMRDQVVGSLLVTTGDQVCGIVTRADLAKFGAAGAGPLSETYCACCGATSHLRKDSYAQLLCVDCRERAEEPEAFDTGGGD